MNAGKDIAEMIGIVSIVLSLVFVGLEVRQTGEIASLEMLDRSREVQQGLHTLMIDNADVWARGLHG